MNNKFKDGMGSTKRYNKQELKTIKVAVRRKDIPESNSPVSLQRDLDNPEDLVIHVRHGEGQRPIFDRDDIRVNEEFKKLIILTDPDQSSEQGKTNLLQGDKAQLEKRHKTNRSPSKHHSRSSSVCSEKNYARQRKYSRERSTSPQKKTFDSYNNSKEHKDDGNRYGSRPLKDEIKKPERKKSRSHSPHYSQKPSGIGFFNKENQYREYPSSGKIKSEYRSRSRERRSLSTEKRERYSKRNRSPSRREIYSPHRSETYRDSSFSEYRSRKRTPSPYKYKPTDAERYRKRSRSSSRTRSYRSRSPYRSERYHESSSKRRSPHRSESRRDYRKLSRSPSRHERHKERFRHYSRSPSHEDRRYRRSPYRSRRRSPSPYKERHDRYPLPPPPPPHLAPINYGPQWYPWPQPLGPRFIPPHGPIRLQRPPFPPIAPIVMGQRPRPPIIYNNRSTKITLVNKTPTISEPTATVTYVSTTDSTSTSTTTTAATAAISTHSQLGKTGEICESTTNSIDPTLGIESSSKEN